MLPKGDTHNWTFRRNLAIVRPLEAVGRRTADGVPYLKPSIQLLLKAKNPRPKDIADFTAVLAVLPSGVRAVSQRKVRKPSGAPGVLVGGP
jgi:hypothetical protein